MKLKIHNTDRIVHLNGVPSRIWEGHTEHGVPVACFIVRVAVPMGLDAQAYRQFEIDLQATRAASPEAQSFDPRLVL